MRAGEERSQVRQRGRQTTATRGSRRTHTEGCSRWEGDVAREGRDSRAPRFLQGRAPCEREAVREPSNDDTQTGRPARSTRLRQLRRSMNATNSIRDASARGGGAGGCGDDSALLWRRRRRACTVGVAAGDLLLPVLLLPSTICSRAQQVWPTCRLALQASQGAAAPTAGGCGHACICTRAQQTGSAACGREPARLAGRRGQKPRGARSVLLQGGCTGGGSILAWPPGIAEPRCAGAPSCQA